MLTSTETALLPFQRRFLARAKSPKIALAALSLPRGNGKSWLAARLVSDVIPTLEPHEEVVLTAASLEQGRTVFRFVRQMLGESYRYQDTSTRCAVSTRGAGSHRLLRVMASNSKTALGLVNVPVVVGDEPGAWETTGGERMHDAIVTAQGKPNSPLKTVFIGTLAPARGGWWHDLVRAGSGGGRHVQALQMDPAKWQDWKEVLRVNPLMRRFPESRKTLRREHEEALRDPAKKATFLSFRGNLPTENEQTMLLSDQDWRRVVAREVPPRQGRPVLGMDLGRDRAWCGLVALWPNKRVEALAVCPGEPNLAEQERRDGRPAGTYQRLAQQGRLIVASGLRIPPASMVMEVALQEWGRPVSIVCDRFRLSEFQDLHLGIPIEPRATRWSESSEDIWALRREAVDGCLSVDSDSRELLAVSLASTRVLAEGDNVRIQDDSHNRDRNDVGQALVFAAGELARHPQRRSPSIRIVA
ncbi:MAG: terminase large subunit [Deltaproteobacteria bacterium]|nr:terminase large subunit [Deltaproteobacteria bacterium]